MSKKGTHDHKGGESPSGYDREVGPCVNRRSVGQELDAIEAGMRELGVPMISTDEVVDGEYVPPDPPKQAGWESWYNPDKRESVIRFQFTDDWLHRLGNERMGRVMGALKLLEQEVRDD